MAAWKQNIVRLLRERAWSQSDLARRAGLPDPYISRLLSGTIKSPSIDQLAKLARAFGIKLSELVGDEDALPPIEERLPGPREYLRMKFRNGPPSVEDLAVINEEIARILREEGKRQERGGD